MCKEMELMRDKSRAEGEMKGKRDTRSSERNYLPISVTLRS